MGGFKARWKVAILDTFDFLKIFAGCAVILILALVVAGCVESRAVGRSRSNNRGGKIKRIRPSPGIIGAFSPRRADLDHMKARGFFPTGLRPVYPEKAECLPVNSLFGSQQRGDGSWRNERFYNGYHGGMDIPATIGTPILAVADGTVIRKKEGMGIGGIGVTLQHSPEDTGLTRWIYTEFKHLREMPDVSLGQRIQMGEVLAYSGDTGTKGGYYGDLGHSHLHLTAYSSPSPKYKSKRIFVPLKGEWMDPLALYRGVPIRSEEIVALPKGQKLVVFAYKTTTGKVVPKGAKVIWPFACKSK